MQVQVQVHLCHQVRVVEERSIPVVKSRREEVNNNTTKGASRPEHCRMCAGSTILQVKVRCSVARCGAARRRGVVKVWLDVLCRRRSCGGT